MVNVKLRHLWNVWIRLFKFSDSNWKQSIYKMGWGGGGNHPIHGNLQWMMKLKSLFIKIKNCPLLPKNKKTFIDSTIYRRHHEVVQTHCKSLNKKVVYRQQYIHWVFFLRFLDRCEVRVPNQPTRRGTVKYIGKVMQCRLNKSVFWCESSCDLLKLITNSLQFQYLLFMCLRSI